MKQAIHHLRTSDPVLSAIIQRVGDGIQFRPPDFETLVKSIVFQQLSGRVASVIFGRLSAAVKGVVTPETILKLRPSRMRSLGLSTQKTAYIRDLARHTRAGTVVFEDLPAPPRRRGHPPPHPGQRHRRLDRSHVPDLRPPAHRHPPHRRPGHPQRHPQSLQSGSPPTPDEMERMAHRWRPYCSVASWYLWRSLEGDANL